MVPLVRKLIQVYHWHAWMQTAWQPGMGDSKFAAGQKTLCTKSLMEPCSTCSWTVSAGQSLKRFRTRGKLRWKFWSWPWIITLAAYCNLHKEHLASFTKSQDNCCILSQIAHFLKILQNTLNYTVLRSSEWEVKTLPMTWCPFTIWSFVYGTVCRVLHNKIFDWSDISLILQLLQFVSKVRGHFIIVVKYS